MGIYIDMEMPEDGLKNIMILADGRVFQFSGYGNPKLLGTAVSVPPHGPLVDLEELENVAEQFCLDVEHGDLHWWNALLNAPIVIPASEEIN